MQKVQVYLYPNRITVLSHLDTNLANTEYRIVYQRTVKLYKGIDNIIELEIKNNDQKRIEIGIGSLKLTLMDKNYNTINIYTADSLEDSTQVGLARVTIPKEDLNNLDPQFLKFTVTKVNAIFEESLTYTNSNFDAYGTMELKQGARPVDYSEVIKYDRWTTETNYQGSRWEERKVYHISEAIPLSQNRAVLKDIVSMALYIKDFIGEIYVEGTDNEVIGNEAFKDPKILHSYVYMGPDLMNSVIMIPSVNITGCTYMRVKYLCKSSGSVDYVEINV
ncbi:MAG: hypothetical protein EBT86_00545 [Actinobacteria bacterium]|nr:hypothetical protein [Actinomycetota bacterium]